MPSLGRCLFGDAPCSARWRRRSRPQRHDPGAKRLLERKPLHLIEHAPGHHLARRYARQRARSAPAPVVEDQDRLVCPGVRDHQAA